MRIRGTQRHGWLVGCVLVGVSLGLAACGVSSTATGGGASTTTTANTTGCPAATQTVSRPTATVLLKANNTSHTVTLQKGQTVEIQLAFGRRWALFPSSTPSLSLQQPSGFGDASVQSCIWRFTATQSGSSEVVFNYGPVCTTATKSCPQYEGQLSFTVTVQ